MKRPLIPLTILFCAGVIASWKFQMSLPSVYTFSCVTWVLSLIAFKKKLWFSLFIACHVFFLGAVTFGNHMTLPRCHIARLAPYRDAPFCEVKGFLANTLEEKQRKTFFVFTVYEIAFSHIQYRCCGKIIVYAKGINDLTCGQELRLSGDLYSPYLWSKRRGYPAYPRAADSLCILQVKHKGNILRLKGGRFSLENLAIRLRKIIENIFSRYTSETTSAMLEAMILGEKTHLSPRIYASMIKSGTVHILVVSGFNVGLVAFSIMLLLKLLRMPRKIRILLTIPLLLFYCLLTRASTPVVRATIMAISFLLTYFLKKDSDIYTSLAFAALCIIGADPAQIFDVGFQLSFTSVTSIVILYPIIKKYFDLEKIRQFWLKFAIEGLCVSFAAWVGTMGFIAVYFKIFAPITILANIIIVPLASLLTFCGFSLLATQLIAPGLTPWIASSSELFVLLLLKINGFLIGLPGAYFTW